MELKVEPDKIRVLREAFGVRKSPFALSFKVKRKGLSHSKRFA